MLDKAQNKTQRPVRMEAWVDAFDEWNSTMRACQRANSKAGGVNK